MGGVGHQHQRETGARTGERCDHLSIPVVSGIEIAGRFILGRLVPGDQLMRISPTVEFYLCAWVQPFGRCEDTSGLRRRVGAMNGFAMESDSPQLRLGDERPAATAGNGAIGISQPGKLADRKPDRTTLADATLDTDNGNTAVGPEQTVVPGQIIFRNF